VLLGVVASTPEDVPPRDAAEPDARGAEPGRVAVCPVCGEGSMVIIEELAPIPTVRRTAERSAGCLVFDTS
jgi:hypothetical protein